MITTPSGLLEVHAEIQKGTYFSEILTLKNGIKFGYSHLIKDFYWNYAYNINSTKKNLLNNLQEIKLFAASINREGTLYLTPDSRPKNILELLNPLDIEEEVWMTMDTSETLDLDFSNSITIEVLYNKQPNSNFLKVFNDAYGGGSPGSAGYFELPPEYTDSIKNSVPMPHINIAHFIGYENDKPVAVSSVYILKEYAGLYNVGTLHSSRRKKYGSAISKVALNFAFENKCKLIFLQTKADSEVEEMYKKIGFKREFIGSFVKISALGGE